jgi:hypothetical protein
VIGGAALGAAVTAVSGSEPGVVLGIFLVAGTLAAALAVQPRAAYRIIPVPALAYLAAAAVTGLIHDRATDTSLTTLVISAGQWIASGFLAMTATTLLAIAITAARWRRSGRGPRGHFYRPPAAAAGSSRRPRADQGLSALRGMREADDPRPAVSRRRHGDGRGA